MKQNINKQKKTNNYESDSIKYLEGMYIGEGRIELKKWLKTPKIRKWAENMQT